MLQGQVRVAFAERANAAGQDRQSSDRALDARESKLQFASVFLAVHLRYQESSSHRAT